MWISPQVPLIRKAISSFMALTQCLALFCCIACLLLESSSISGKQVQRSCPKEEVECTLTVASNTAFQLDFSADSEQFQEPNSDEVATPDSRPSTSSSGTRAIVQEPLCSEMALIDADLV